MARTGNRTQSSTQSTRTNPSEESPVTEPTTDTTDTTDTTESTPTPDTTDATNQPSFTDLVDQAAGAADLSTGTVPEANVAALREALKGLRGKVREAALQYPAQRMTEIMTTKGIEGFSEAQAYGSVSQALASAPVEKRDTAPVDPYEAPVAQAVALMVASALVGEADLPDGVDRAEVDRRADDLFGKIDWNIARTINRGDDVPEGVTVPAYVAAGVKIANGKGAKIKSTRARSAGSSGGASGGPRRDLGALIDQALADGGPMKIADLITGMEKIENNGKISSGAVTNRFWTKNDDGTEVPRTFMLNGRTFTGVKVDGVRGAQAS